jgi:dihydrofolate synthase/folylpolyglutamate synthase
MLNTKTVDQFLAPLSSKTRRLVAIAIPGEPNSLAAEAVRSAALGHGMSASVAPNIGAAVDDLAARGAAGPPSRVLICGSLYLIGKVLADNS